MVNPKDIIKSVNEGVIGMTTMQGLQRMQELAGIREGLGQMTPAVAPAVATLPPPPAPMDDDIEGEDDFGDGEMGMDDDGEMGMDQFAKPDDSVMNDDMPPMDNGMGDSTFGDDDGMDDDMSAAGIPPMADDMGDDDGMGDEMPGDVAPEAIAGTAESSPAYTEIEDALNNIQRQLVDVSLSEYKQLVQRLEDVTKAARQMGQQYLGEGKGLKRAFAAAKQSRGAKMTAKDKKDLAANTLSNRMAVKDKPMKETFSLKDYFK